MNCLSITSLAVLLFSFLAGHATGQEEVDPNLPIRIQKILNLKCGQCHASTIRKPKGAFGYVDDLARVKEQYSVDTDLEENDLWYYMVDAEEDEIMPPPAAKKGALTKKQIALFKTWILAGSPLPKKEEPKPKTEPEPTKKSNTLDSKELIKAKPEAAQKKTISEIDEEDEEDIAEVETSFFAPFHPVLVHFPIALIMVAALMEMLRCKQGEMWRPPLKLLLSLVLISAFWSGFAGFRAQDAEGYSDATVEWHQWSAIAATALAAIATWLLFSKKELNGIRLWSYRLALLISAILFGLTGHEGGILVHGADHFG